MNGIAIGPLASTCIILLGVLVDGVDKWFSCAEQIWRLFRAWGILSLIICLVNQGCSGCQRAMGGCCEVNNNNPQPPPDDNPPGGNLDPPPQSPPPTSGDECKDPPSSTNPPVVNVPVPVPVCIICGYAHPNGVTHGGNRTAIRGRSGCTCSFL